MKALMKIGLLFALGCQEKPVPTPAASDSIPTFEAAAEQLEEPLSRAAAAALVRDYYAAVARRDYRRAHQHWEQSGAASGKTFEEFSAGYQETASVETDVGRPGALGAAAGSRYVDVPVWISATTTHGQMQRFRGKYTLRRAVVDGATAEQWQWHIYAAAVQPCDSAACIATSLVERLGNRLASVSLLAPPDIVRRQLQHEFAGLVTPELLSAWMTDPASAPGRSVSSPWPQRIEVLQTRRVDARAYEVTGDVVYVTSVEATQDGAATRERISARVTRYNRDDWRIFLWRGRE